MSGQSSDSLGEDPRGERRRVFRLDRLAARAKLAKSRKWIFLSVLGLAICGLAIYYGPQLKVLLTIVIEVIKTKWL